MLFMKFGLFFLITLLAAACHKTENTNSVNDVPEVISVKTIKLTEKPKFSRPFRESVYFAKSLEREALKLLLKDSAIQKNTLFSVLSYIIENESGSKKSTPNGLDCGKYVVKYDGSQTSILKACRKPYSETIFINTIAEDKDYEIRFYIGQWGSVLGMAAMFTGSDIKCRLSLIEQKLSMLSCENWTHQAGEDQLSTTVIKTTEFLFQRNAEKQFVIKGGFYKELIQNKKIDIVVPLEGKIKIIEKELKVIDEFSEQKNGVTDEKKERIEIKPVIEEKVINQEGQQEGQQQEGRQEGQQQEGSAPQIEPKVERRGR